jgi:parallel beta-helix repeat protein
MTGGDGIYGGPYTNNNTISNNNVNYNYRGIRFDTSSYNTISNNTASFTSYQDDGIYLYDSHYNIVKDNVANYNNDNIVLVHSDYNILINNTANNAKNRGFWLWGSRGSDNNTITNNRAFNNTYGFYLSDSNNNTLTNNTAPSDTPAPNWICFYGFYLSSSNNNTLINNTVYKCEYGFEIISNSNYNILTNNILDYIHDGFVLSSSYNILTGNTASNIRAGNGFWIQGGGIFNRMFNNTAFPHPSLKYQGLGILMQDYWNNVTGGSVTDFETDYDLRAQKNYFRATNFTGPIKIATSVSGEFWYNNFTDSEIWLRTGPTPGLTYHVITRKLTSWTQSLMQWNDSFASAQQEVTYNITGLKPNTNYNIYNYSQFVKTLQTDDSGKLPGFNISLNSSDREIKVEESGYLTIEPILSYWDTSQGKWFTSDPLYVDPISGGNRQMNVTVNFKNSTTVNTCLITIFNSTMSYSNPTKSIPGTIWKLGSQMQCYGLWYMEYWMNPDKWNVSVNLSDSISISNFTSKNFTYNELYAWNDNITTNNINWAGLPGQKVNSSNAYPMMINNTGNTKLDININGNDFIGQYDSNYIIGVGNVSFGNTTPSFTFYNMSKTLQFMINLSVKQVKYVYFRSYIPKGFISQQYNNSINMSSIY